MPPTLTIILLIAALVHLFLHVYNRYLLCMTDSPIKPVVHQLWFLVSVLIPTGLVVILYGWPPLNAALRWAPESNGEKWLFAAMMALILFFLYRSLAWALDRFIPEVPRNLAGESIHQPIIPAIPPRLPRGLRRFETTGDLVVVERDLAVPGLAPAFDGITVAQVSDIHFGARLAMESYFEAVVALVNRLDPDIVVLTGDFVDNRRDIQRSIEYHAEFRGRLATFCVLGNHDYWTRPDRILDGLRKTHIRYLGGGERRTLKRAGRRLIFTGTDAPWTHGAPDLRRIVRRGTGDAVVLLSHTPDNAPAAARHGASLILSGHNHGGQVCVPFFGPFVVPSRYGLKYSGGVYRVGGDSLLNVSRGVGVSEQGFRVNCHPEIHLLRLHAPSVEVMVGEVLTAKDILRSREAEASGGYLASRVKGGERFEV